MRPKRKPRTAPIMGIERLRDNVDGPGIRTLVLFDSCPLNCDYCLNKLVMSSGIKKDFTVEELYNLLQVDDPYFDISQGGITFGGGEPALQSRFIEDFYEYIGGDWSIMLETSLNVPLEHIQRLAVFVDRFYVDIKDMNPQIYLDYTRRDGSMAYTALEWLAKNGYADNVIVRIPLIPNYNTEEDQAASIKVITEMGLKAESFKYIETHEPYEPHMTMGLPNIEWPYDDLMGDLKPEEDIIREQDEREE
ncbi:MAG: radical SAM protein [Bacteroidales bacterium]|nr:radical SAM protein [Bacteroidales bacterium]